MERSSARPLLTAEEFQHLPDEPGYRLELVRGQIARSPGPAARHGEIEANLVYALIGFVRTRGLGRVLSGGSAYVLERGPDTARGPDISFVARDRFPAGRLPSVYLDGAPDLAIEILSPSNRPAEMRERVTAFLAAGSREIWLVDPREQQVRVHAADGSTTVFTSADVLTSDLLPGFRCPVSDIFASQ